jgi:signal transduction histidine kinase
LIHPADFSLITRLEAVSEQIERQWGLRVELDVKLPEPQLPIEMTHEIYYIVHEALVNAARHAGAATVCAEIELQNDQCGSPSPITAAAFLSVVAIPCRH